MKYILAFIYIFLITQCSFNSDTPISTIELVDNINIKKINIAQTIYSPYLSVYQNIFPNNDTLSNIVSVTIQNRNSSHYINVMLEANIDGYTTPATTQCYINSGETKTLNVTPLLTKEAFESLNENSQATMTITLKTNQDDTILYPFFQESYTINLTSKNMAIFKLINNNDTIDITNYLAMWVTPNSSIISDSLLPLIAQNCTYNMLFGYQDIGNNSTQKQKENYVYEQIKAIYETLQQCGISYINNVIGFGGNQKIKYPKEVISTKSANCIEGTLLFASIIEAIGINPILIIEDTHAFVGWEKWDGSGSYNFLETTLTWQNKNGDDNNNIYSFDEAVMSGNNSYNSDLFNGNFNNNSAKFLDIKNIRQDLKIYPTPLTKKIN